MAGPAQHWRVSILGRGLPMSARTVQILLRVGLLSGVELVRPDAARDGLDDRGWRPLHDTQLFTDEVPHVGDAAVSAHRRRLMRWLPPAMAIGAWLLFFVAMMISEPPGADDLIPLLVILGVMPSAVLTAWTLWFAGSFGVVVSGRASRRARHGKQPAMLPDLDFATHDAQLDALRAQLEVERALRS